MTKNVKLIKIFASCPSDVNKEKDEIRKAIESLTIIFKTSNIAFELIEWKQSVPPQITGERPQAIINKEIKDYDIYVGVFWKKFGNIQENGKSPTEEEFEIALKSYEHCGYPLVLMYFVTDNYYIGTTLEAEQVLRVSKFKEKIQPLGIYCDVTHENFFKKLIEDLSSKINDHWQNH